MIRQANSLWDAVGNTPLLNLGSLSKRTGNQLFGKAEFMNPGGSIKDRTAKGIIRDAEARGLLKPGDTIVEGTAGNTGIGLTMLGRERGYRVVITMPDNQAREKYELLEAMGADIRRVPVVPFSNENHFYHQARKLSATHGWFWANQFENLSNSAFHAETTAEEIWTQCEGKIDILVASCGTGGSLAGISQSLKAKNPKLEVVLVDPFGSGLYSFIQSGKLETTGSSITEGIGIMRLTANFKEARIDSAMRVGDQEMIEMLYHLATEDALVVGTSAALNARAAYEMAKSRMGHNLRIVTLLGDHGSRYASKIFNAEFLASKGLAVKPLP